ncbi:hypothetical protein AB0D11_02310 [Streptomyces monashensis]|uniref:hypothetical protein n=1 Tax=Streptomyces monashensis TaxID=1678012 RepID=UPI0033E68FF7
MTEQIKAAFPPAPRTEVERLAAQVAELQSLLEQAQRDATRANRERNIMRERVSEPYGCRYCGEQQQHHGRQYIATVGMHSWEKPDDAQVMARMLARRAARMPLETEPPTHGPLWSLLDWSFWGAGMGDVFRMPLADAMVTAVPTETIAQAEAIMAEFIERRQIEKTGVTIYQEQHDELERLRKDRDAFRDQRNGVFQTNQRLIGEIDAAKEARLHAENQTRTVTRTAEELRARVAELEAYANGCDAEGCVLPHSSWCERAKKTAAENDGCTCGQPWQGHPQPHAMHCWSVNPPRTEVEEMRRDLANARGRIAELEAERKKYVGAEPTIAEEMAYLSRCIDTVDALHLPDTLKVDSITADYRNGYIHALADMRTALEAPERSTYPPALPWARLLDDEDLAEFLSDLHLDLRNTDSLATPAGQGQAPEILAAVEKTCATWRVIAEAQHAHNTAPGPGTKAGEDR